MSGLRGQRGTPGAITIAMSTHRFTLLKSRASLSNAVSCPREQSNVTLAIPGPVDFSVFLTWQSGYHMVGAFDWAAVKVITDDD